MAENVIVERNGPVTIVTINRPERRNAVDGATAIALEQAFRAFDADENALVAILTGAGGGFCAGADLKALASGESGKRVVEGGLNSFGPMGPTRLRLSKPVIAAIEGHAVAGGMELALWCDLRVVAEDATFGIYCRRFGVPLVDLGTIRLPRLIGHSRAMDLMLTGRPVDAQEALAIGLANRLTPSGDALVHALTLAKDIAAFPQACMRNDRLSAIEQWDHDESAAIDNEIRRGLDTLRSGETLAGAKRFSGGKGRHGAFDDQ
ncbi:crotonase/enoyl-CoA hydratase family protein [Terricaulis silvestris]|uniref:Putative enoyl-CoA hydratase echA8 n=1 Tax=Terricaulis silvestris TaxID=2686094 RepID=A0A6I6MRX9_9CAUL|nr:crotonase/enoyl-CoA hydratase family protein [Terricaulis silvestris]QGZ95557.1 putative enoyl-CoA hydratase echA8 [Terricaulis silvestris]